MGGKASKSVSTADAEEACTEFKNYQYEVGTGNLKNITSYVNAECYKTLTGSK